MEDYSEMTTELMNESMDRKIFVDFYGPLGLNITGNAELDRHAIEEILKEKNITLQELMSSLKESTTLISSTANSPPGGSDDNSPDVSWGMIVPIILIVIFLVCVGFCLYWHSWRDKRRKENVDIGVNTSFGKFNRSSRGTGIDHVRDSTRSTTPLRNSFREKVQVTPLQYPDNQKFTFYWDNDNWKLCPPEAQARQEVNMTRVSALRQQLSPINEIDTPMSADGISDMSKSYNVSAQAPFSPYHLTWVTPQAPPPSYEESEVSSPSKNARGQSLQTTNTTQSEESCSTCVKYGKSIGSPFFPNNNTPTTEYDLGSDQGSLMMKINSAMTTNTNSQFTSYPSSPRSTTSAGSLTTSNIDTGVDASNLTSTQEPTCPPSSLQSGTMPSTNQTSERTSQTESDLSGGVPSLPSSILYYHQRMTVNNNVIHTGNPPVFSHVFNASVGSSLESTETHYTDDTSMLPNVGSSNTSGNPTASLLQGTTTSNLPVFSEPSQNASPEDLSKIVNELSSIRIYPNEATSINKGVVNSMIGFDGAVGQSYVAEIGPNQCDNGGSLGDYAQSITELFRSCSVIAELDYSSLSSRANSNTPMSELSSLGTAIKDDQLQYVHVHAEDFNHNVIDLNNIPMPGRRVTFDVPILVDKTYWV